MNSIPLRLLRLTEKDVRVIDGEQWLADESRGRTSTDAERHERRVVAIATLLESPTLRRLVAEMTE